MAKNSFCSFFTPFCPLESGAHYLKGIKVLNVLVPLVRTNEIIPCKNKINPCYLTKVANIFHL